ncbi:MAG: helix-turn-helix transcriptional regulator [Sandarakinorhabdus sp.]|nr:helix-turn-helix transcriptional regulator [Sandarakinorhabdus sp.]
MTPSEHLRQSARRVRVLCKARGYTGAELARRARCDRAQASRWIRGTCYVPIWLAQPVADALGTTPGFLLFGECEHGLIQSDNALLALFEQAAP